MKLIVDEMHAGAIAVALRSTGLDALAVTERMDLRGMGDEDLLSWAATDARVIVTENIGDFAPIEQRWRAAGRAHAGLVFTNPRRFHRASIAYPSNVVEALGELGSTGWPTSVNSVWWL